MVTLMVQNAADLAAAPMQIRFDPKFLRLDQVALGTLLGGDGKQVLFTKNILNDAGEATVDLKRLPNTGGVNGSGTLVTLTFQAVGRGATLVGIPNVTLRNSQGQTIGSASPQLTVNVR